MIDGKKRRQLKNQRKMMLKGMTQAEIEEHQRKLFENDGADYDSDDEFIEGTSESKSAIQERHQNGNNQIIEEQVDQDWEAYKASWISHNKHLLDEDYQTWVISHIQYNLNCLASDPTREG